MSPMSSVNNHTTNEHKVTSRLKTIVCASDK